MLMSRESTSSLGQLGAEASLGTGRTHMAWDAHLALRSAVTRVARDYEGAGSPGEREWQLIRELMFPRVLLLRTCHLIRFVNHHSK